MMDSSTAKTHTSHVQIPCEGSYLDADLTLPQDARGLILFAHGSGSSRLSPRNQHVAAHLHSQSLATLLLDLLKPDEAEQEKMGATRRFDIPLLSKRLGHVIEWASELPTCSQLEIGCFGSSTGAAAALVAAAHHPEVRAVVSRGGRSDLASGYIANLQTPVLLLAGSKDTEVIRWNRETLKILPGIRKLTLIEGAGHLFEEPGTLDQVASLAADWFTLHLHRKPAPVL
jgi:dienelactone hydrolase